MNGDVIPAAAAGTVTLGGDMTVRRMGFGGMRLTGPGIIGDPKDRDGAIRVLQRAVELGVNFIDTADAYGPESNERLIADALRPYSDGVVIATKGGSVRGSNAEWNADGRPEHLRGACEASLRRLDLERIDLYQLHTVDPRVPIEESVGALAELQREGKIRHIGLSNVDVRALTRARAVTSIVSVQNRYNAGDRASEDVLHECERSGLAFLPYFPLGAGDLARDESLAETARRHRATPAQIALAWLLNHSPVMLAIPGTSAIAHLEENVRAAAIRLEPEERQAIEA